MTEVLLSGTAITNDLSFHIFLLNVHTSDRQCFFGGGMWDSGYDHTGPSCWHAHYRHCRTIHINQREILVTYGWNSRNFLWTGRGKVTSLYTLPAVWFSASKND